MTRLPGHFRSLMLQDTVIIGNNTCGTKFLALIVVLFLSKEPCYSIKTFQIGRQAHGLSLLLFNISIHSQNPLIQLTAHLLQVYSYWLRANKRRRQLGISVYQMCSELIQSVVQIDWWQISNKTFAFAQSDLYVTM